MRRLLDHFVLGFFWYPRAQTSIYKTVAQLRAPTSFEHDRPAPLWEHSSRVLHAQTPRAAWPGTCANGPALVAYFAWCCFIQPWERVKFHGKSHLKEGQPMATLHNIHTSWPLGASNLSCCHGDSHATLETAFSFAQVSRDGSWTWALLLDPPSLEIWKALASSFGKLTPAAVIEWNVELN